MSEREPITTELRVMMNTLGWYDEDGNIVFTTGGTPASEIACLAINSKTFGALCDSIDAVHAGLERENAELREVNERQDEQYVDMVHRLDRAYEKNRNQRKQLTEVQEALHRRNEGELKRRWMREKQDLELQIAKMRLESVELPKDADGEYIHEHDKVDWRDHAGTWHENAIVVAVCNDGCYVMDGTVFLVHKSDIRHHHAPTVEDVLREFSCVLMGKREFDGDVTEAIAEYAAKLRLAGDAE